jgi:hypothetical protein
MLPEFTFLKPIEACPSWTANELILNWIAAFPTHRIEPVQGAFAHIKQCACRGYAPPFQEVKSNLPESFKLFAGHGATTRSSPALIVLGFKSFQSKAWCMRILSAN